MTPAEQKLKALGFIFKSVDKADSELTIYEYNKVLKTSHCDFVTSLKFHVHESSVSVGLCTVTDWDNGKGNLSSTVIDQDELNAIQERCKELEPAK